MDMATPSNVPQPLKLRIADFELLDRAGVFEGYHKVELIDGEIVVVQGELIRHNRVKNDLAFRLRLMLRDSASRFSAWSEATLSLPDNSLPEPDVIVAAIADDNDQRYYDYRDIGIVIEVADTTLRQDLVRKRGLYARHDLPEYWVLDLQAREVHQFWSPADGDYADTRVVPLAGELRSATISNLVIDGTGIL